MKISDLLKMGLRNLFRRKARTALTIFGMIIGTVSIVVMLSIGAGIKNVFDEAVMKDGSLSLIYVYQSYSYDQAGGGGVQGVELNDDLINKIREIPNVKNVSGSFGRSLSLESGKYQTGIWINVIDFGTAADFGYPKLEDGTSLSKENNRKIIISKDSLNYFWAPIGRYGKNKAVDLTQDKVTATFQDYQPRNEKKPYKLNLNESYAFLDAAPESRYAWESYMDIDYFKEVYEEYAKTLKAEDRKKALKSIEKYDQLYVNVQNIRQVADAVEKITELGVQAYSSGTELNAMIETADMLQTVFGAIGLVALLVSAINIANTMVMSIYERTKEIGIMKVLGCLIKDIRKLFLFEAGLMGLIGGIIGVGFSFLASWGVNKYGGPLLSSIIPGNGWYVDSTGATFSMISFWLPFEAILISVVVSLVAGYFPARRATKISAIEAMKTEG